MTTSKEEVLRLAYLVGFTSDQNDRVWAVNQCRFDGNCNADITDEIKELIELVRKEAIAKEREAIAKICLDKRRLNSPEALNWNIALISVVEALIGRE